MPLGGGGDLVGVWVGGGGSRLEIVCGGMLDSGGRVDSMFGGGDERLLRPPGKGVPTTLRTSSCSEVILVMIAPSIRCARTHKALSPAVPAWSVSSFSSWPKATSHSTGPHLSIPSASGAHL